MAIVEQLSPYITLLLWIAVRYVVKKFFFFIYTTHFMSFFVLAPLPYAVH